MTRFIARQKLRLDMGQGCLTVLNFALLAKQLNYPLWIAIPVAMLFVWSFGFILDRARFLQAYQAETNHRNEMLRRVLENSETKI